MQRSSLCRRCDQPLHSRSHVNRGGGGTGGGLANLGAHPGPYLIVPLREETVSKTPAKLHIEHQAPRAQPRQLHI